MVTPKMPTTRKNVPFRWKDSRQRRITWVLLLCVVSTAHSSYSNQSTSLDCSAELDSQTVYVEFSSEIVKNGSA